MSDGFQSPNHTQVPNDLFDSEMATMSCCELKVVLAIIRQTLGFHRKHVKYGINDIVKMTGLSRQSVLTGAREAEAHGYIQRINPENITKAEWKLKLDPLKFRGAKIAPPLEFRGEPSKNKRGDLQNLEDSHGAKESIKESVKEKNAPAPFSQIKGIEAAIMQNRPVTQEDIDQNQTGLEAIPAAPQELLLVYSRLTGQRPSRNKLMDWLSTANEWLELGAQPLDIEAAYAKASPANGTGFMVARPGSLTNVLSMVVGDRHKSAPSNLTQSEKQMLEFEKTMRSIR
jgi:hypothetical protein